MRITKLRRPGAVRQESGAGALVTQLIKDALQQLGGAKTSLIQRWVGVSRKVRLSHRYSSEWIGSPFSARVR